MKELIIKKTYLVFLMVAVFISSLFLLKIPVHAAPEDEEITEEEPVIIIVKPTLNASISDKALTINAKSEKGIKAIYVNGYEFEVPDGDLRIKLTQFDAGYEKFYICAEDMEGIMSDVYEVENPYFDKNTKDDKDPKDELPTDVSATKPSQATGEISEHIKSGGRDFYQIETEGGRTFYLIVDTLTGDEKVYFLTEVSERDLLNVTSDNSEKLPRNSAIPNDGIKTESVNANNNAKETTIETVLKENAGKKNETKGESRMNLATLQTSSVTPYIFIGVGSVGFLIILLLLKKKKKKKDSLDVPEIFDDEEENEERRDKNGE